MIRQDKKAEGGYVLLGVLVLLSLSLVITAGMLDSSATNSKTRALVNTQADYFYQAEETLHRAVSWLQTNSKSIVTAFTADNFNNNFDLGSPAMGDNEGQHFGVPTMVKMKGTNQSVMLSNNSFFGQSAFPATTHLQSGAAFNAVSAFESADLGEANARVILTWARHTAGNYEPIFRVDVVTGNNPDRGVHSYSYVYSHLVAANVALGFYGRDFVTFQTPNNNCFSYEYSLGGSKWVPGAPRSNCPVASDGPINISSTINGTAATLQSSGVALNPPGGSVTGDVCEGSGCHGYTLPIFGDWNSYCPAHNGDLSVAVNTTLPNGGCYRDIGINNHRTLTLTDYNNPYYFRKLDFRANFAKFGIADIPAGEKVTIYVETLSNNHMNGNQFYNPNFAPHQLEINYTGTAPLTLNGTAQFNAAIIAPKIPVTVNGNFNFYGGIKATSILVSGNARVNYDEGLGGGSPVVSDLTFQLKKASQRYR